MGTVAHNRETVRLNSGAEVGGLISELRIAETREFRPEESAAAKFHAFFVRIEEAINSSI